MKSSSALTEAKDIAGYLGRLVRQYTSSETGSLILPSIFSLARFFGVTSESVRDALSELKQQGIESFAGGLYGHVSLWAPEHSRAKQTAAPEWWQLVQRYSRERSLSGMTTPIEA